jgi:Uma2 family endonuclease
VGVQLPNEPVPLQPDIVFVSTAHQALIGKQYIEGVPDLVVEILSPSNWTFDRKEKFQVYQAAGIPEYWIVDYRAKTVETFTLEEGEYVLVRKAETGEMVTSRAMAGFQVAVADVFRDL